MKGSYTFNFLCDRYTVDSKTVLFFVSQECQNSSNELCGVRVKVKAATISRVAFLKGLCHGRPVVFV